MYAGKTFSLMLLCSYALMIGALPYFILNTYILIYLYNAYAPLLSACLSLSLCLGPVYTYIHTYTYTYLLLYMHINIFINTLYTYYVPLLSACLFLSPCPGPVADAAACRSAGARARHVPVCVCVYICVCVGVCVGRGG
jgi:hypothetical protein